MSSRGISFSGLASGLDSKAIIAGLLAIERRPIDLLQQKKKTFQSQRDLFGQFERMLESLKKGVDGVRKTSSFLDFKAEVDDDKRLSASVGSGAVAGSYEISVLGLARGQVSTSAGVADKDTTKYGSGTGALNVLKITIDGITTDIVIDDSNNTLEGIAGAINDAGLEVQASVLDTGTATDPYKLVLSSKRAGADAAFTVGYDPAGSVDFQNLIDGITTKTEASDAHLQINGVDVYRRSNVVSDAISGVTLNLKGEDKDGSFTKLTISTNTTATGEKIKGFVDAYNEIVDFVEAQSQVSEKGETSALLFGDSTLRSIRSTLRSVVGGIADTGSQEFSLLSQVGVSADRDGKLSFDQGKFDEALSKDEEAVRNLFAGDTGGIATRLNQKIESLLSSTDGVLQARQKGLSDRMKDIDTQVERMESRLERYELTLVNQFSSLEQLIGRLQSQGSALSGLPSTQR